MSAVSIGGQTFIKSESGWVDKKTKQPAPEGLMNLLNNVSAEESPAGKKARVRIDTSRPVVKLGKSEYVWDLNGQVWIDKKTKDPVNPNFSRLIEATYQSIDQGVTPEEELYKKWAETAAKGQVFSGMGVTGKAAQQKVKKPSGGGTLTVPNVKINSPIVTMIEKLATIDGYLKQRLDNQKKIAAKNITAAKEAAIENLPVDAEPVIEKAPKEDAEKSNAAAIGVALVVGGLIAAQFEPVQEAFKSLVDGVKGVWNFVNNVAKTISDGLDAMTGTSSSSNAGPAANRNVSSSSSTTLEPSVPNTASETSEGQLEPNETNPSTTASTSSADNATPVIPAAPQSGNSSRLGRTVIGASVGAAVAGPVGAIVGGAVGFLSSPSTSSSDTSSSSGGDSTSSAQPQTQAQPQATQTAAPSPGATSNQSLSRAVQLAAGQVGVGETGIGDYLRQGGVGLNPRNEQWCAAFVNSTLAQSGLKGATNVANSFQKWGDQVPVSSVQEGDVVILTRGKGPDVTGGHVGIATGVRQGNRVEIIAGNTSNKVKRYFVADDSRNVLQVRRYNPEKPYGAGAVGGAPLGGTNPIAAAATAAWDLSAGVVEALGGIIKAGLGPQVARDLTDSLVSSAPSAAAEIGNASVQRVGAIAQSRSESSVTANVRIPDPPNLNAGSETPVVENIPTSSDFAGVEHYLTRMGFPKIEYAKPQQSVRYA